MFQSKEIGQTNDAVLQDQDFEPTSNGEIEMKEVRNSIRRPNARTTNNNTMAVSQPPSSPNPRRRKKEYCLCKVLCAIFMYPCKAFQIIKEDALIIDKISRVVFPLSFMLFNGIYWVYYKSEHNTDEI